MTNLTLSLSTPLPFLRTILLTDAATSAAAGLLMAVGAEALAGVLGLPATLLRYAGLALLPFAAALLVIAIREPLPRTAVWVVIVVNAIWVALSVLLLLSGWVAPTALGIMFVLAQAAMVLALTEAQYVGLRRTGVAGT